LLEERFTGTFRRALDSYREISRHTNVEIHSHAGMEKYLRSIIVDFEEFKNLSLRGSQDASKREAATTHQRECLVDGTKATFCIENYLGGTYYLTPDEIFHVEKGYIIQESKNSTRKALPDLSDIQDGLFKLILYSNIDFLQLNGCEVDFAVRLKLTGQNVRNRIVLPCPEREVKVFLRNNVDIFDKKEKDIIERLLTETQRNERIEIEIRANH
jgi:hypothetical protein